MAARCHLLRALMLLDGAGSYDVMRAYMRQRDRERERFCFHSLYPELIRLNGWTSEGDVRFGIFVALDELRTGNWPGAGIWQVNGLIDAAPSIVSGTRLAEIVVDEIRESSFCRSSCRKPRSSPPTTRSRIRRFPRKSGDKVGAAASRFHRPRAARSPPTPFQIRFPSFRDAFRIAQPGMTKQNNGDRVQLSEGEGFITVPATNSGILERMPRDSGIKFSLAV
jgi:hypothetical protein